MDPKLEGNHVFVTGASGGIGLVTAEKFLAEGANVTLHYNRTDTTMNDLLENYPENTFKVQADVKSEIGVISAIDLAVNHFGRIHTIIINHGIWIPEPAPLWEMSLQQWNETISIDLTGAFLFAREFLRQLEGIDPETRNVNILFVGSTAGTFGEADHADYSTAKAGLMYGMTKSLKNEIIRLHPRARVNSVMPGWILTPMAEKTLDDPNILKKVVQTMALEKIGRPRDVANALVFLASEELSGHTSGDILGIAGGMEGRVLRPFE
jgi:NAD(P)-dependent dehydrogenase (short-subunit alcohol dehydrogenase family)